MIENGLLIFIYKLKIIHFNDIYHLNKNNIISKYFLFIPVCNFPSNHAGPFGTTDFI